jgi:hypothetical protein
MGTTVELGELRVMLESRHTGMGRESISRTLEVSRNTV